MRGRRRRPGGAEMVLAHRGNHTAHPENSLAALLAARDVADGFETDVRETADGVLVLSHDPDAPDGLPIASRSYEEVRDAWSGRGGLARLDSLLEAVDPGMFAFFEVKVGGVAGRVIGLALPVFGGRLRIGGFDPAHLAEVPGDIRWLIVHGADEVPSELPGFAGIAARADAYPFGLAVRERAAWRADAASATALVADGVRFLISDDPARVRDALSPRSRRS